MLLNTANRVQQLLCSNILADDYKKDLLLDTYNNRQCWLIQGLEQVQQRQYEDLNYVILHIPETFPMTFKGKHTIYGKLKETATTLKASPIINIHP